MIQPPTRSTLFPYTTLFRSESDETREGVGGRAARDQRRSTRVRIAPAIRITSDGRSEEHTSELQSLRHLVCRLLLEKKKIMRLPNRDGHTLSRGPRHQQDIK